MARKKKTEEAVEIPAVAYTLSREEALEARALLAEADRDNLKIQLAVAQRREYIRQIDPENNLGKYETLMRESAESSARAKAKYNELFESVEKRLNIKMSDFSWDDETGLLTPL